MDVNATESRRELDLANRLMREREAEHTREINKLRDSQKDQIRNLDESHTSTVNKLRTDSEDLAKRQRQNFDQAVRNTSDSYEKTLQDERSAYYDKFGRFANEKANEQNREKEIRTKQFEQAIRGQERDLSGTRLESERTLDTQRLKADNDKQELKKYYDVKLDQQRGANSQNLSQSIEEEKAAIDKNTREMNERLANEKRSSDLRYQKLADESTSELNKLSKNYEIREKQLADEKNFSEQRVGQSGAKALEEYRQRLSDNLSKTVSDNNFVSATKDQRNASTISEMEHNARMREAQQTAAFRRSENDLKHQADSEKDRNKIQDDLSEHRHQQDLYVNTESIRQNNELSKQALREKYNQNITELADKDQRRIQDLSNEAQKKMNLQDKQAAADRARLQTTADTQLNKAARGSETERNRLIKDYENRQRALEETSKRQIEGQHSFYEDAMADKEHKTNKVVADSNRENTLRMFIANERLKNTVDELNTNHHAKEEYSEKAYEDRLRHVNTNYNKALLTQKDTFDENANDLRNDAMTRMTQIRSETDRDRRLQLLDLQNKNRILASTYESKLTDVKEEHAAELSKLKAENDKLTRDTLKKTKEMMDRERSMHVHEMEIKDRQMTEKLRLQEEAFKEQIEKLKRSNELTLKKS